MARSNEYQSKGGSFEKLTDAISTIDELLQDVKRADEKSDAPIKEERGFRNVIAELQANIGACVADLKSSWAKLELDPLYIYSTEKINVHQYVMHVRFLHPEYQHVWLTEGKGRNVAVELIPFIDYGLWYDYKQNKITVDNFILETKLNLPDFKTSLRAAHVDLEILKEDAERVELVCSNGDAAHKKLTEMLQLYCDDQKISLEVNEEEIPCFETKEERTARLKKEEAEAKKAAEAEARRIELEEKAIALQEELQRKKKKEAKKAVKEAQRRKLKPSKSKTAAPPENAPTNEPPEEPKTASAAPPAAPAVAATHPPSAPPAMAPLPSTPPAMAPLPSSPPAVAPPAVRQSAPPPRPPSNVIKPIY